MQTYMKNLVFQALRIKIGHDEDMPAIYVTDKQDLKKSNPIRLIYL